LVSDYAIGSDYALLSYYAIISDYAIGSNYDIVIFGLFDKGLLGIVAE
jgi:hypothetical protein